MAAMTYPPGVLTGRPMEMFEASPTLDLYAVPEQWLSNKDTGIFQELCDALEDASQMGGLAEQLDSVDAALFPGKEITDALEQFEEDFDYEESLRMNNIEEVDMEMEEVLDAIDQDRQEEMDWIEQQLQLLDLHCNSVCRHTGWRYQDKTDYYRYPMVWDGGALHTTDNTPQHPQNTNNNTDYYRYPMVWDGGVIVLHDFFSSFGIKEALQQFEEDFDYEQSLVQEKLENTEVNLHRLLAAPHAFRPGWCGRVQSKPVDVYGSFELLNTERYKFKVKILTSFPRNKDGTMRGYCVGITTYGVVYFPLKFAGYVPPISHTIEVTCAFQGVSRDVGGESVAYPFTAIYIH